ncbi:hypothetical protein LZ32DRAFT_100246 [Colletotrichum eremochloae]|nr:hypothetical protein LZ32DRAFT_100246 [Colletotrichum eremochloae]
MVAILSFRPVHDRNRVARGGWDTNGVIRGFLGGSLGKHLGWCYWAAWPEYPHTARRRTAEGKRHSFRSLFSLFFLLFVRFEIFFARWPISRERREKGAFQKGGASKKGVVDVVVVEPDGTEGERWWWLLYPSSCFPMGLGSGRLLEYEFHCQCLCVCGVCAYVRDVRLGEGSGCFCH